MGKHSWKETEKTCAACGEIRPNEAFKTRGFIKGTDIPKRRSYCDDCRRGQTRSVYAHFANRCRGLRTAHAHVAFTPAKLRDYLGVPATCALCGDPLSWALAQLDHKVPKRRGGQAVLQNMQWTHRKCNWLKGSMLIGEFRTLAEKIATTLALTEEPEPSQ